MLSITYKLKMYYKNITKVNNIRQSYKDIHENKNRYYIMLTFFVGWCILVINGGGNNGK